MAIDGFTVRLLVDELKEHIEGGRINKIYQPFLQEIQIQVRQHRKNHRLHLSIHPENFRCHLTEERPSNPKQAPMFCMLMRKHLEGGWIKKISQQENDRVIHFEIQAVNEMGDDQAYRLVLELMGRHSNLILIEPQTGNIIDCQKHVPDYQNSFRDLVPGAPYKAPPKNPQQKNLFQLDSQKSLDWIRRHSHAISEGKASRVIQGLGSEGSQLIAHWIQDHQLTPVQAMAKFLEAHSQPQATTIKDSNHYRFYWTDLAYLSGSRQVYPDLSQLMEAFYKEKTRFDRVQQLSGDITARVKGILDKNYQKLLKLDQDRQLAQKADLYKLYGELLNAYHHQLEKGQSTAQVINYYTEESLDIPMDSRLTPIENSQNYFKKYSKYRDSLKYIHQQVTKTQAENDYLEGILVLLDQADIDDIEEIRRELTQEGYGSKQPAGHKKRSQAKSKPRQYTTSQGIPVYVGRNNRQNDKLSMKSASKNHYWFHTQNIPGSHVILASDQPDSQSIQEAAEIAAYHSRSKQSANVPVDYVKVKQLNKPKGGRPGFVTYTGQETIVVTPVEADIQRLENN